MTTREVIARALATQRYWQLAGQRFDPGIYQPTETKEAAERYADEMWPRHIDEADRVLLALTEAGMVVVRKEPDSDAVQAGYEAYRTALAQRDLSLQDHCRRIYRAMLEYFEWKARP